MRAALLDSASLSSAPIALFPLAVERTYPTELAAAVARGAVVVDIRRHSERAAQGTLPGALAIDAALVPERLDPTHPNHLAMATGYDKEWILVSAYGADTDRVVLDLRRRGLRGATALVGGYAAVKSANLVDAVTVARHVAEDVARVTAH
ncbi:MULTISPECIES: rhodanese-like domain-containing protein [unclassified Rhodococcus (in: high G+C Gram-positive bacteria)]|uniref:rhodanese-like domain-containing protein n=1 Tax=unclassified Rhodococcus (in: high G+C Gram-positive bacteria) TaxID=192944 RepID=UPI003660686D